MPYSIFNKIVSISLTLTLFISLNSQAGIYFTLSSKNYTESFRVHDLIQEKATHHQAGKLIYSNNRLELGYQHSFHLDQSAFKHSLALGYLKRADGIIQHSKDSALIYYYEKQEDPDIPEREYRYKLAMSSAVSEGVSIGYQVDYDNFLSAGLSLDTGDTDYLIDGEINGLLNYQNEQLNAEANIHYFYSKDTLFNRRNKRPEGKLHALNLFITLKPHWGQHSLSIQDAYHQIEWPDAPFTIAHANSDRVGGTDSNGKLIIRPFGSGIESHKTLKQKHKARYYFNNSFKLAHENQQALVNLHQHHKHYWLELGYQHNFNTQSAQIIYSVRDKAFKLGYDFNQQFSVLLGMDHWHYKKAQRLNLNLQWRY